MRILIIILLAIISYPALSQGPVDRIELGYATTKRGIEWTRPGLPTHVPVFRISRDTNTIIWHDKNTGMRYEWDYLTSVWYARGRFSSSLPPLPTQTSGLATIDNRTAFWINAANTLHHYDLTQTAWVPDKITYQSASPTNVASGISNGAAVYTTTLWQDSDDFLVRYWDGDSWELFLGNTDLTYSGTSSPLTLNSSTGTDVTHTAGTGISLSGSTSNMTITNTAPDQTVSITGAGINVVTGTYPNFTITGTEVDGSISNEGSLTVGAGSGTTSIINSNTSGSTGVTLTAGTGLSISEVGNVITLTNSSPDQTVSITGAGISVVTGTYPTFTITSTEVDGSVTNELQTYAHSGTTSYTNTLSGGGGSWSITGAGIAAISQTAGAITVTATEVDGSISNEGILGVGAGSGTSSTLLSTTSGANAVTINAAGILAITESISANGGSITLTATEVDGSVTNEAQALTISGTTSGIITLASAGGAGGGVATIAAGTGVTVAQSGGTITIASTGLTSATGYINGGNSFGALATIGLNDNFDWAFETNGTNRMWIDNTGPVTIGATRLIDAALNINLLQNNTGLYISGGSGLGNPFFIQTRGNGSGSNCTVLDAEHSMINGNVEATITNTATSGTGGTLLSLYTDPASTGDPRIHFGISATTDWSIGIDNDDVDVLKLHRFAAPSDNNGQGTIEFGYRTNDIGIAVNKTAIGTTTNGFYALDAFGKARTDQYANNALDINAAAFATIALGTAAGTSPTVDNTVTSVWGNGAHLKFTSGTSPTANGVICTVTLNAAYTFGDCVSDISAITTNASGFGYSSSFNSGTRVITFTLNGTLAASTVYEFGLMYFGRN